MTVKNNTQLEDTVLFRAVKWATKTLDEAAKNGIAAQKEQRSPGRVDPDKIVVEFVEDLEEQRYASLTWYEKGFVNVVQYGRSVTRQGAMDILNEVQASAKKEATDKELFDSFSPSKKEMVAALQISYGLSISDAVNLYDVITATNDKDGFIKERVDVGIQLDAAERQYVGMAAALIRFSETGNIDEIKVPVLINSLIGVVRFFEGAAEPQETK